MTETERKTAKITRRRVIGEVACRIERVAAAFPRNIHTIPARVEGHKAARALRELAEVLRVLEEDGPEAAWTDLSEPGFGKAEADD